MGKKAGRKRRRPRGRCPGTKPPSSRPRKGACQEAGAGPPPAPTPTPAPPQGWKRGESSPWLLRGAARWPQRVLPPLEASTRPPLTAPGWWRRTRGPGASAPCPAACAQAEPVRAHPETTRWRAPGRQPSAGPCQEPQGPRRGGGPAQQEDGRSAGEELREAILRPSDSRVVGTAAELRSDEMLAALLTSFSAVIAKTPGRDLLPGPAGWRAGPVEGAGPASAPPPAPS